MNYYQTYYFTEEEIEKVNNNLIIIFDKICSLKLKLDNKTKTLDPIEINRIEKSIDRLQMSRSCIKYYYNI
tara:strand:+ start:334 stop:546 length:213 start_codon:yes stop_codon:yes gene_type:complete